MKDKINEEHDQKLIDTVFFIESTSFETQCLWRQYNKECSWEQDSLGFWRLIGYVNNDKNMPITLFFTFAFIFGKRICFYQVGSRYNDTEIVRNWFKSNWNKTYDNGTRIAMTDANNFHHAYSYCKYL